MKVGTRLRARHDGLQERDYNWRTYGKGGENRGGARGTKRSAVMFEVIIPNQYVNGRQENG